MNMNDDQTQESAEDQLRDIQNKLTEVNFKLFSRIFSLEIEDALVKAANRIIVRIALIICITVLLNSLIDYSTDKHNTSVDSDLPQTFLDAQTGCQYIVGPLTGMTPRLNKEGIHICDPNF